MKNDLQVVTPARRSHPGLRVSLAQISIEDGGLARNLELAEGAAKDAARQNVDLLNLPEAADYGWLHQQARRDALRHVVPARVPEPVLDLPTLVLHPALAFDNPDDGARGGRVVVAVPSEVERMPDGLSEIARTVNKRRQRGRAFRRGPRGAPARVLRQAGAAGCSCDSGSCCTVAAQAREPEKKKEPVSWGNPAETGS